MSRTVDPKLGEKWENIRNGILWKLNGHPGDPVAECIAVIKMTPENWRQVETVPIEQYIPPDRWKVLQSAIRKLKESSDLNVTDFTLDELSELVGFTGEPRD